MLYLESTNAGGADCWLAHALRASTITFHTGKCVCVAISSGRTNGHAGIIGGVVESCTGGARTDIATFPRIPGAAVAYPPGTEPILAAPVGTSLSGDFAEGFEVWAGQVSREPCQGLIDAIIRRQTHDHIDADCEHDGAIVVAHIGIASRLEVGVQGHRRESRGDTERSGTVGLLGDCLGPVVLGLTIHAVQRAYPDAAFV